MSGASRPGALPKGGVDMALIKHEHFELPELFRRLNEFTSENSWLRVEEFVEDDAMVFRVELPGLDPDHDVELTITDGVLDIKAHREEKSERKGKDGYRSEFRYGSLHRSVELPAGTKEEDVKASYTDGILEIKVPVGEAQKTPTTTVPITRG
jgi:HSP20 family protein